MSTSDKNEAKQTNSKVVRLKIEGARNTVNTLSDQQTRRGVSLVCPFPALEVNLPASFGAPSEGEMTSGTIHRIGVEDDPETGLPRLRLSIRCDEDRRTAIERPKSALIDASIRRGEEETPATPKETEEQGPPLFDIASEDEDPKWVNCDNVPLPEEFMARTKTRRRYKTMRKAAVMAGLIGLAALGFGMERAGIVKIDDVRSYVAGLAINSGFDQKGEPDAKSPPSIPNETSPLDDFAKAATRDASPIEAMTKQSESIPEPPQNIADPKIELASATPSHQPIGETTQPPAEPKEETQPASENLEDEVTIILPTRWPVEYASGYRIRDPNGVVIDVPGGLVKKEGWLEQKPVHPMIRSIKSIQRETGARFIVHVNGDLPKFMTSPKTGGVSLRLYDLDGDSVRTQEVAMAD